MGDGRPSRLESWPVRTLAATAVVVLACGVYALLPHGAALLAKTFITPWGSYTGLRFLGLSAAAYVVLTALYHAVLPVQGLTKSVRFFLALGHLAREPLAPFRGGLAREERVALLTTLLKVYFGPTMTMWLMAASVDGLVHVTGLIVENRWGTGLFDLFNQHGFWILMRTIFFVDLCIYTVGYLVESPRLGNEIRSVDPTFVGWAAAMLCYPPFNELSGMMLGSQVSEFPRFEDPALHLVLNGVLLVLMALYASASVALGLKASNLTHRGIVARGPYAVVRHPAYVCKNAAWWIGSIPAFGVAFQSSAWEGLLAVASMTGWTTLYALRAVTEENHLRSVDGDYDAYASRVRWRFIPGLV